jgi:predicted amidohydrolase YtcJ
MSHVQNTTVFVNGRIFNSGAAHSEAQFHSTLAIQNGKISFIGSAEDPEVQSLRDAGAKVSDLGGNHVLPGFIDGLVMSLYKLHRRHILTPHVYIEGTCIF